MVDFLDNEYQDPRAVGSLSGALDIWQAVRAGNLEARPHHLIFTFSCGSEPSADRIAGFLRHRLGVMTGVTPRTGHDVGMWHLHGSTPREIQSLSNLEQLSTWLRGAATSHGEDLIRLTLVQDAA